MSAREKLLKRRPRTIEVDGDSFTVRAPSIAEQIRIEALNEAGKPQEAMNLILATCLLEEDGTQMFSGAEDADIALIPLDMVPALCEKITELSRPGKFKATVKNSDATP